MSKRVYEIAREQSLETKEVMERLKNAGVEVKNHFAVIEDPVVDGISASPRRPSRLPPRGVNPVRRAGASGGGWL
ncbi:MAG: translation initiation factor IF-2 N-terminal domain-containing protein [Actinobacteria bacterium]|nr:translation initiation factor IF-2 N-terminal domain-containing protein [Actinomycetota bacterium]